MKLYSNHKIFNTKINNFANFKVFHEIFVSRKFGAIRTFRVYSLSFSSDVASGLLHYKTS